MNSRTDTLTAPDRDLAELLARHRPPAPRPGLFEASLAKAVREQARRQRAARTRRFAAGMALAAGLAAVAVFGLLQRDELPAGDRIPTVSVALDEPRTVQLVFAADTALDDATMTLSLPSGVEVHGFPGQREIRWETSLAPGRNLLPLTLVATAPGDGEVRARLEHDTRDRTFRLRVHAG